ncbi:MAG: hypothetical protein ACI8X5_003112 [Planctomycetota bacterium]|jgi:hypothetical protein
MAKALPWIDVPCDCDRFIAVKVDPHVGPPPSASCKECNKTKELHPGKLDEQGGLYACQACGHPELYTAKDLPKALGIGIVVIASILAPFTNYISLFVAGALDFGLYFLLPETVFCYECETEHRGFSEKPRHSRFDLQISDRLKYGKKAVMGKDMREGGTADGPEPEH